MTARACAGRTALARSRGRRQADVRAMVQRFDARIRARVAALASSHVYFEDLMWSFPGLLHALCLGDPEVSTTRTAHQLVRAGAPLRAVARLLAVPMWTRALAPEAFGPARLRVPDTIALARDIHNSVPKRADAQLRWLEFVAFAAAAHDDGFALWTARIFDQIGPSASPANLAGLALFAWFSERASLDAGVLVDKPWNDKQSLAEACNLAQSWMDRLDMPLYRAPYIVGTTDVTFVDGFEFVPLARGSDVYAEAEAMCNCLAGYADVLASGRTQVWGIRHNGDHAASIEVVFHEAAAGLPELVQIKAKYNAAVPQDVLHAAYRWLLAWPLCAERLQFRESRADDAVYRALMKPYWLAKGLVPWLPLAMEYVPLDTLRRGLWTCTDLRPRRHMRRRALP